MLQQDRSRWRISGDIRQSRPYDHVFDNVVSNAENAIRQPTISRESKLMGDKSFDDNVLYLGIDGGGTNCRAVLADAFGDEVSSAVSGPANPFHDMQQALSSIRDAAGLVLSEAGINRRAAPTVIAGIGLAGVNLPSVYDAVMQWNHQFDHLFLTTDLEIACIGAHSERDGAVIVSGTGSSGCSIVNGQTQIVGAHGFPLGDFGGGAWIGLEAIKASLLAEDGFIADTHLTDIVYRCFGEMGEALVEKMAGAKPAEFARVARFVIGAANNGDVEARRIVKEGADYLSEMGRILLRTEPPSLAMLGGLSDLMRPWLDDDIGSRIVAADTNAVAGSLLFAKRKYLELQAAA